MGISLAMNGSGKGQLPECTEAAYDRYLKEEHPWSILRGDSEQVNKSRRMNEVALSRRYKQLFSPPGDKAYNGLAENHIKSISNLVTMMYCCARHASESLWVAAWMYAEIIHSLRPSRRVGSDCTKYEDFFKKMLDMKTTVLLPWACPVECHIPKENRSWKFAEKTRTCMYMGPTKDTPGSIDAYDMITKMIIVSASYRILAEVPSTWRTYPRSFFLSEQDDVRPDVAIYQPRSDGVKTRAQAKLDYSMADRRKDAPVEQPVAVGDIPSSDTLSDTLAKKSAAAEPRSLSAADPPAIRCRHPAASHRQSFPRRKCQK